MNWFAYIKPNNTINTTTIHLHWIERLIDYHPIKYRIFLFKITSITNSILLPNRTRTKNTFRVLNNKKRIRNERRRDAKVCIRLLVFFCLISFYFQFNLITSQMRFSTIKRNKIKIVIRSSKKNMKLGICFFLVLFFFSLMQIFVWLKKHCRKMG